MIEARIVDAGGMVKCSCRMPVTVLEQPRPMVEITGGVQEGEVPSLFLNGETELTLKATDEEGNPLSGYKVECEVPYSRVKADILTSVTGEDGGFQVRIHSPKSPGYCRIDIFLHGSDGRVIGNGEGGRLSFLVKVFTRVTIQTVIEMVHQFNLQPGERGKVISALASAVSSRHSGLPPADLREAFLTLADSDAEALYNGLRVVGATQLMTVFGQGPFGRVPRLPEDEWLRCQPGWGYIEYIDRFGTIFLIWCGPAPKPPTPPDPDPDPTPLEGMPIIPYIPFISTSYTIAVLIGFLVDVDVDSDNNNGFDTAAGGAWKPTTFEERIEDSPRLPGKVVGAGCDKRTPAAIRIWGLTKDAIGKRKSSWRISFEYDKSEFFLYRESVGGSLLEPNNPYTAEYLGLDKDNPANLFIEGNKQTGIGGALS